MSNEESKETQVVKKKKKWMIPAIMGAVFAVAIIIVIAAIVVSTAPQRALKKQLDSGDKYLADLDYENAILAYEEAIKMDPKNESAYLGLTSVYEELAGKKDAEEDYEAAIDYYDSGIQVLTQGIQNVESGALNTKLEELNQKKEETAKKMEEHVSFNGSGSVRILRGEFTGPWEPDVFLTDEYEDIDYVITGNHLELITLSGDIAEMDSISEWVLENNNEHSTFGYPEPYEKTPFVRIMFSDGSNYYMVEYYSIPKYTEKEHIYFNEPYYIPDYSAGDGAALYVVAADKDYSEIKISDFTKICDMTYTTEGDKTRFICDIPEEFQIKDDITLIEKWEHMFTLG